MSSDSRDTAPGTLVVAVPFWAATVRVFDNSYRPVEAPATPVDDGQGRFQVSLLLTPGVYRVEVALGGTDDSEWVSVRSGKRTEIKADRWSSLQLASAAPLGVTAEAASKGPDVRAQHATQWSQSVSWLGPEVGHARLFIYIQTPDPQKYPDFSRGLSLLDKNGIRLTGLDGAAVRGGASQEGCVALTTDLAEGFYILARQGPGDDIYNLPLYVCDHWETQIFMTGGKGPSFRSVSINMAPFGHGFRYDDDTAAAAEAVLSGLRRERGTPGVLGSSHLNALLRREQKNPWLAVLAAYALTAAEVDARVPESAVAHLVDPTLMDEVLQFLRHTIPTHPDVRALFLDLNAPSPIPFDVPPLTRIGLQRVRQHSTRFVDTIPVGSLTDRMLGSQLTTSPWSVWVKSGLSSAQGDSPVAKRVRRTRSASEPTLRTTLGPGASVASRRDGESEEALRRVLYDLPLIKAAQNLVGTGAEATPDKIELRPQEAVTKLLAEIDPSAFSAAAGIPLGRAESVLDALRSMTAAVRKGAADPAERAILQYAVRKGTTSGRFETATKELPPPGTLPSGKRPGTTLEEFVVALRDASEQLLTPADEPGQDPSIEVVSRDLGERLRRLAEQSLQHADLVAITDTKGRYLYGNGAFDLLMSLVDKKDPLRASRRWSKWLSQLPPGRSSEPSPEPKLPDRRWTIRRVPVEDQETGETTAFVNVFDDESTQRLPPVVFDEVVAAASDITLQTSFVQYASTRRRYASLERLEQTVKRLEQKLSASGGLL